MEKKIIWGVGNYYGGIWVMSVAGKFYWIIENYDTDFEDLEEWEEISKELYDQLLSHTEILKNQEK